MRSNWTNRQEGNEPREDGENGYLRELAPAILSMNKYLLVVTPGLEHLLRDEISTYASRLSTRGAAMKMLKGGIEIARSILMDSLIRAVEKEKCAAIVSHSRLVGEGIYIW